MRLRSGALLVELLQKEPEEILGLFLVGHMAAFRQQQQLGEEKTKFDNEGQTKTNPGV